MGGSIMHCIMQHQPNAYGWCHLVVLYCITVFRRIVLAQSSVPFPLSIRSLTLEIFYPTHLFGLQGSIELKTSNFIAGQIAAL